MCVGEGKDIEKKNLNGTHNMCRLEQQDYFKQNLFLDRKEAKGGCADRSY